MGLTAVSVGNYTLGGLGMIPGTIVYIFIGTTIGSIQDAIKGEWEGGTAALVLLIVGAVAAFIAIVWVSIVIRKYLRKALAERKEKEAAEQA